MGNFSRPPNDALKANLDKGYVSAYIEQGVPVLDRDLNLMHDLIASAVRSIVERYVGDGVVAGNNGFNIRSHPGPAPPPSNNFVIMPGSALVGGIEVTNPANAFYAGQPGAPPLTTPAANRTDTVYLDVSLAEVNGTQDPDLLNSGDVGLQTSVRQKAVLVVRVAEGAVAPPAPGAGHTHFLLARLARTAGQALITAPMITDLRNQIIPLRLVADNLRVLGAPAFAASPNQFTPKNGAGGVNVTLFGKGFNFGGLKVRFESLNFPGSVGNSDIVTGPTDTQVVVRTPFMSAGPHKITVETNFGVDTSDDNFNIL